MSAAPPPYDQRLARMLVRPLARTPVHPNHVSVLTAVLGLGGAALFATGDAGDAGVGAALFVLARFLDHVDGELARETGRTSRLGYWLDYLAGGASYGALFACMALGLSHGALGAWAFALGAVAAAGAVLTMWVNVSIDRARGGGTVRYPSAAGFELEDGIYLLAPVTWAGLLAPFFVLACIGVVAYLAYSLLCLRRARAAPRGG